MTKNFQKYNTVSVLVGILLGWYCGESCLPVAQTLSSILVRVMQCLAVPITFFSLLSTIMTTQEGAKLRKTFRHMMVYVLGTTIVAASIGLFLYILVQPAVGVEGIAGQNFTVDKGTYLDALIRIVPTNIFDIFISGNVIGAVICAVILGLVGRGLPSDLNKPMCSGARLLTELFLVLARHVVRGLPFFLWTFAVLFVQDLKCGFMFSKVLKYMAVVFGTHTIHSFIVLPLLLKFKGFSPFKTIRGAFPAYSVASLSKSSAVAIPTTLQVCTDTFKVRPETARFTVPVCATINMNGCSALMLVTSIFMIEVFQGPMTWWGMFFSIFLATVVAIGNAGVPMGCFFMTLSVLSALDVPTHMLGVLLPWFTVQDMYETGVNVWSDVVITRCIDKDLIAKGQH